jgi:hypothetical protein
LADAGGVRNGWKADIKKPRDLAPTLLIFLAWVGFNY